jgi:large repetitive protein
MRLKLALVVVGVFAAIAVTGASAADFEGDNGPCRETPGENALLRCPTGFVGAEYEVEIESEEGSGCTSPGNPYVWYEIVNSSLPPGLSMTRAGVISGVPTTAGFRRFWIWNHDLTEAQGGPSWCQREDRSEREFSIYVEPGLEIVNESVAPASIGQPYSDTLTTKQVVSVNGPDGPEVHSTWSVVSGALPPGITLSTSGVLSGIPTAEGSFGFDVKAVSGSPQETKTYTLSVRQPMSVNSPFGPARRPSSEVGIRLAKTFTATGGSGTYTWALASGTLPTGVTLDTAKGAITGTPRIAGNFAFTLAATDSEGRASNANAALTVAPRLAFKTNGLKPAKLAQAYQVKLATTGGVQPVAWRMVGGKLPLGISLSKKAGTITGTPRRPGSFPVTLEARDALGAKSQRTLVLLVQT